MQELSDVNRTKRKSVCIRPIRTSSEKIAPAIGALKVAATPAAAPQATMVRTFFVASRAHCPMVEPIAAPIWTIGPSRPAVPPKPMVIDEAMTFTPTTRGRILPPRRGQGRHHFGYAVPLRFLSKTVDQGADEQPADGGEQYYAGCAENAQRRLDVTSRESGEFPQDIDESDRPQPGQQPDCDRKNDEIVLGGQKR